MRKFLLILVSLFSVLLVGPLLLWLILYRQGRRFALRDPLHKSDAIIVLAGTRGSLAFLDGKIRTAVQLYQQGWASHLICSGRFSVKVTNTPQLIPVEELQEAVQRGRIQEKDVAVACDQWDVGLGASYMIEKATQMGVPCEVLLMENEALHTRENAEYVLALLQQYDMHRVILVTSPFHQLRTYLTFAKVFQPHGIEILNYYADAEDWHPMLWFLFKKHRLLVKSEKERIVLYREKGDLL
ncbi:MAG: YdcF family protein [Chloroflexi bacterium]|nr:MAG: YdcF family protein [Chloroflexota bacterium]